MYSSQICTEPVQVCEEIVKNHATKHEENLKGCVEEITSKKEEMFLLTGENQTFSYQFRYKDFWKSLTTEPEDKLSGKKADFMVMQQIFKAAEQVCEKELNRRKWQDEDISTKTTINKSSIKEKEGR